MALALRKLGNSSGARLPKPMRGQVGVNEGAQVDVTVEGDHLVARRERAKLADLLTQSKKWRVVRIRSTLEHRWGV